MDRRSQVAEPIGRDHSMQLRIQEPEPPTGRTREGASEEAFACLLQWFKL